MPRLVAIGAHLMQCATNRPRATRTAASSARRPRSRSRRSPRPGTGGPIGCRPTSISAGSRRRSRTSPSVDTGAFSYASHAAVVAVDTELGHVEILDYVIAEDCGTLVNPMVVDGQTLGGAAQGIGTALYEESPYDANGQPLASTFADYLLPGPTEVPKFRIFHLETPSPYTKFGIKGMGEGGAIAPPAVIFNAVNDALRELGVEVTETPLTPRRLLAALERGRLRAGRRRGAHEGRGLRICAAARPRRGARDALRKNPGAKLLARRPIAGPMLNLRLARPRAPGRHRAARRAAPDRRSRDDHGASAAPSRTPRSKIAPALRGSALLPRSPPASPIAPCAIAARSAAASRMPIRPPTGRWRWPRSAPPCMLRGPRRRAAACRPTASCSAAFTTALADDEICRGRAGARSSSPAARFGYFKFCRKTGEFPEASAAVAVRSGAPRRRGLFVGALAGAPQPLPGLGARARRDGALPPHAMPRSRRRSAQPRRSSMPSNGACMPCRADARAEARLFAA